MVNVNDSKRALGGRNRGPDFKRRLASTRALVAYSDEDEARVHATRDILLPHAEAMADAVYRHLLSHPETAVYFTLPDGRPDRAHLAARVDSLKAWLQMLLEAPLEERTADFAAGVGRAHVRPAEPPGRSVKGRYLVVTMPFVLAAIASLLEKAVPDRVELVASIAAWDKLLTVHLDLFLAVYGSAESNPHWY